MTQAEQVSLFYGDDLAYIHSEGFASHWDGAAARLAELALAVSDTPFAVDIGCGDGRMLAELDRRGVPGRGFDISESFVELARARGVAARVGDATNLEVPPATLVIALGEVLAYEGAAGDIALEHIVHSAADSLAPGGALVFDFPSSSLTAGMGWFEGEGWLVASENKIIDGRQLERRIVMFRRRGSVWYRRDETHRLRLLDRPTVDALLEEKSFVVEHLPRLGESSILPGREAYLARRV